MNTESYKETDYKIYIFFILQLHNVNSWIKKKKNNNESIFL